FFFSSRRRHTRFSRDWSSTCALPILPGSEFEPPAPVGADFDLLVRQRQADAAAALLALDPQLADFAQHRPHRIRLAGVDARLHRSEERRVGKDSISRCTALGGTSGNK